VIYVKKRAKNKKGKPTNKKYKHLNLRRDIKEYIVV
jgi:hypothetical protein